MTYRCVHIAPATSPLMFVVVPISLLVQHVTFEYVREVLAHGLFDSCGGGGAVYIVFEVELRSETDLYISQSLEKMSTLTARAPIKQLTYSSVVQVMSSSSRTKRLPRSSPTYEAYRRGFLHLESAFEDSGCCH